MRFANLLIDSLPSDRGTIRRRRYRIPKSKEECRHCCHCRHLFLILLEFRDGSDGGDGISEPFGEILT